ncbi:MAG: hypothetical protein NC131_02190 [Roseburia sp.]|nr:hypothetical protein [Roseburia sp.]
MSFFDMCHELFIRTSKYHDLGKDIENLNKYNYYKNNYYRYNLYLMNRKDIEDFIVDVRFDNPIFAVICQLAKATSGTMVKLHELNPDQLYLELQGEIPNIIFKGAYDSIKLLYNLDENQSKDLATRIAMQDMTIFNDYKY